jgi:hypothetical protein
MLKKVALVLAKNANIFAKFFGENIFKILTWVPDWAEFRNLNKKCSKRVYTKFDILKPFREIFSRWNCFRKVQKHLGRSPKYTYFVSLPFQLKIEVECQFFPATYSWLSRSNRVLILIHPFQANALPADFVASSALPDVACQTSQVAETAGPETATVAQVSHADGDKVPLKCFSSMPSFLFFQHANNTYVLSQCYTTALLCFPCVLLVPYLDSNPSLLFPRRIRCHLRHAIRTTISYRLGRSGSIYSFFWGGGATLRVKWWCQSK